MIHHVAASEYVCVNCTVKCCFVWCHNTLQLNDPVSLSIRSIKALHCLCHISGKELKCTVGLYWILSNYKIVFYFYFMFHVAVGSVISNLNERKLRQKKVILSVLPILCHTFNWKTFVSWLFDLTSTKNFHSQCLCILPWLCLAFYNFCRKNHQIQCGKYTWLPEKKCSQPVYINPVAVKQHKMIVAFLWAMGGACSE